MEVKNERKILLKKIYRQGKENMIAAVGLKVLLGIGFFAVLWFLRSYTADVCLHTLEQETLKSDTGMDLVSRVGIVLPDNRILQQDGTLSEPVNGITFDALDGKRTFITNMEPDNLDSEQFVLFFNVPIEKEGQTEGILFGVIEPQTLSDYFRVDIFDGNADVFIIDTQNMEMIMDTLHRQGDTGALEGHQIKKGYRKDQIGRDFADGKCGITAYFSKSFGEYLYTAYEPVGITETGGLK